MARFLIVDDHPLFREALTSALRLVDAEADIYEATSIEGALDVLDAHDDFELALLDLSLPGTTGFSGLIRLRTSRPKLPILVVSGHEEPAVVREALTLGIAGYVPKSTSKKRLAEAIAKALAGDVYEPELPRSVAVEAAPVRGKPHPAAAPGPDAAAARRARTRPRGPAEQGDRARAEARRNHDQGACVGGAAQTRRGVAHPGGDRGRQGGLRGGQEDAEVRRERAQPSTGGGLWRSDACEPYLSGMAGFGDLEDFIDRHRRLFVLTGAGCSTNSGIPDYRDADGQWKRAQPMTYQAFMGSEATRRRYWARSLIGWRRFHAAQPNAAHRALARLENLGQGRASPDSER